jgi:alkylation response protein AidB-like acyl-CoA dehydrogenase
VHGTMGDVSTRPADVGRSDPAQRARDLVPLLDERAAAGDEQAQLTEPVVEALHDTGMFGMWTPRELGGSELDPLDSLRTIEQLPTATRRRCGC